MATLGFERFPLFERQKALEAAMKAKVDRLNACVAAIGSSRALAKAGLDEAAESAFEAVRWTTFGDHSITVAYEGGLTQAFEEGDAEGFGWVRDLKTKQAEPETDRKVNEAMNAGPIAGELPF